MPRFMKFRDRWALLIAVLVAFATRELAMGLGYSKTIGTVVALLFMVPLYILLRPSLPKAR